MFPTEIATRIHLDACSFLLRFPLILSILVLAMSLPARSQSTFGTILGNVHDASGAVIPGATVTLTNTGTTAQRVLSSDGAGDFVFSNIDMVHTL